MNETLSKITNDRIREKIKYVYLAGVQIIIKSLFLETLNTPIVLSLHDLLEGCPHNYYRSMSTTMYRRVVHIIIIGVCPIIYVRGLST